MRTAIDKVCGVLETPATLSRPLLETYIDFCGATFLTSRLGIRPYGLLAAFKWSASCREPITAGQRVILRLFEVCHYSINRGILQRVRGRRRQRPSGGERLGGSPGRRGA